MQYKDLGVVMETMTSLKVYCTSSELLSLSVQVAEGLEFMHNMRYIHRDIAARNVLLGSNCQVLPYGMGWVG